MRHVTCIGILALLVADELICLLSAKALNMSNWNMELPVVNLERKSQLNPSARKLLWLWVCQQALCGAAETGTSQLFVQSGKMRHVTCIGILALLAADELICLLSAKALNMSNWNMELPVVNLERKSQLKPSARKLLWLWVCQ